MARLIGVVHSDEYEYKSRQMPLEVEDKVKMILQFPDVCVNCGSANGFKRSELDRFIQKYTNFDLSERDAATSTTPEEIAQQLASLVPCVGCRKSVERLLDHVSQTGNPTLDPLVVSTKGKRCQMQLRKSYREDPKLFFALLYTHGDKLQDYVMAIPRSKKNKRCQLHSLDTQKTKTTSNWMELWELLSDKCKDEVLMIDYQKFMEAMIVYLDKHRFCIECKTKVLHAHGLLIGDEGKKKDKSFCPALYEGVDYCKDAKHVHVKNDRDFIASLIARAEPDLLGSRRERHAKTLDIAQEEVLTCLGSYLYVRFNRLLQKVRLEEQTWRQLFYITTQCLRRNYELTLEKKQGFSQLELLCSEFELEEKSKVLKKETKKQKKKKSKQSKRKDLSPPASPPHLDPKITLWCDPACSQLRIALRRMRQLCGVKPDENDATVISQCKRCEEVNDSACVSSATNQHPTCSYRSIANEQRSVFKSCTCDTVSSELSPLHGSDSAGAHLLPCCNVKTSASDLGYSSGPENCDSCSASTNSSELVTTTEVGAVEAGESNSCCAIHSANPHEGQECGSLEQSYDGLDCDCDIANGVTPQQRSPGQQLPFHSTLEEMLETECLEDGDEPGEMISEEDIAAFKANLSVTNRERLELREKLKQRFDIMKKRHQCCTTMSCSMCDK